MAEAGSIDSNASIEIETENTDSQKESDTTNENDEQYERMVSALEIMVETPSFKSECRFNRIPDHLRKVNEQAYSPMIISIGPFHHFDVKLQTMEKFKVRYLNSFMKRANINMKNLVDVIWPMKELIYSCYAGAQLGMDTDDFLKIILVDAIFILELIYRNVNQVWEIGDLLIADQMDFIGCDLVLFENQLPFFVLEELFNLIGPRFFDSVSLIVLTFKFFDHFNVQGILPRNVKIEHFTDLFRIFQLQLRGDLVPERLQGSKMPTLLCCATQLHDAGVKFQVNSSKCLLDIKFDVKYAVLEMPCLQLDNQTETLIQNVMAFELYCFGEKTYIRDYYLFLDCLVNTTDDIDLLCDMGIIHNYLGDNNAATSLVKKLAINVSSLSCSGINPIHNRIFVELNAFYKNPWHKWKAGLRHQYFNTPWRTASSLAAFILLVFTFIQTVCSIVQIGPIV